MGSKGSAPDRVVRAAMLQPGDVLAWVKANPLVFRPYLLVTKSEVVFVKRGVLGNTVRRVPRDRITSAEYHTGVFMGRLTVKFGGEPAGELTIEVQRRDRLEGEQVAQEIQRRASG